MSFALSVDTQKFRNCELLGGLRKLASLFKLLAYDKIKG